MRSRLKKLYLSYPLFLRRLQIALDVANFVTQLRCPLIVFVGDRFLHLASQSNEFRLRFGPRGTSLGNFADVLRFPVNIDQQRLKFFRKANVIVWATESSLIAKLVERDPTHRTSLLVELREFFGRLPNRELLCQNPRQAWGTCRFFLATLREIGARTILTEMKFLWFPTGQLRDMKGRRFFAALAFHCRTLQPRSNGL